MSEHKKHAVVAKRDVDGGVLMHTATRAASEGPPVKPTPGSQWIRIKFGYHVVVAGEWIDGVIYYTRPPERRLRHRDTEDFLKEFQPCEPRNPSPDNPR